MSRSPEVEHASNSIHKPRALDLFCKAGGATKGLQMAGFHVTGVDIEPQPRYCGDAFILGDALTVSLEGFDFIWASPPCQAYTSLRALGKGAGQNAPKLIEPVRHRLIAFGIPFVIENVMGSPIIRSIVLCGSMFKLRVLRHRLFESRDIPLRAPSLCHHNPAVRLVAVYGDHPEKSPIHRYRGAKGRHDGPTECTWRACDIAEAREAMGIDWMEWRELTQAIPPAYSDFIGKQVLEYLRRRAEAA